MFPSTLIFNIPAIIIFLLLIVIYVLSAFLRQNYQSKHGPKRPPGPMSIPIIGNIHLLGKFPHRKLESLSKKYGPIMSLWLGQVPCIVVSSPEAAELFLKSHDPTFASRPKNQSTDFIFYGTKGVAFSEYGSYWRDMKKMTTLHLLSASKVDMFGTLRKKEVLDGVKSIRAKASMGEVINLSETLHGILEDIVYKMILGRCKDDEFDLKGLVRQWFHLGGAFNLADYVPWLAPFDLQGLTRRMKKASKTLDEALEKILKEHEESGNYTQKQGGEHKDFIDILLSLMNDEQNYGIGRDNIKAIALEIIFGAYETTAVTVEWVFSELLRNKRVMKNVQQELHDVIGMNRIVEETDLPKLNYLHMVIKETLRLYPVGPFVPRGSIEDAVVDGYFIEKNSRILVNVWAIGRDPKIWSENAHVFYPERFLECDVEFQGQHFELIPFGSGRRKCPGIHMGVTSAKHVLAQFLHCFNWELPRGMAPCDVDMNEVFGFSIPRAKPLFAVPTQRIYILHQSCDGL